jgi:hypothetical protein
MMSKPKKSEEEEEEEEEITRELYGPKNVYVASRKKIWRM